MKRFLSLIDALCLLLCPAAHAEAPAAPSTAIVDFDRTAMEGWTPGYSLSMPGVLLELSHTEGMASIAAVESAGMTPQSYLSERLDRFAETLSLSDARLVSWADSFDQNGRRLSFSYTYPDGDEVHLCRIYAASMGDLLIELNVDVWGEEAEMLMQQVEHVFIEGGFSLTLCEAPFELIAVLTDVEPVETGHTLVSLGNADGMTDSESIAYPLSANAVILFPNPDEPTVLYPVAPDMASLSEAIWTYEENSDSPAVFYAVIENGEIVYMEYSLMI